MNTYELPSGLLFILIHYSWIYRFFKPKKNLAYRSAIAPGKCSIMGKFMKRTVRVSGTFFVFIEFYLLFFILELLEFQTMDLESEDSRLLRSSRDFQPFLFQFKWLRLSNFFFKIAESVRIWGYPPPFTANTTDRAGCKLY